MHGYGRQTTPEIERIGADGLVFDTCITHGVATASSTASIMTGTYPSKHRVGVGDSVGKIPDELQTAGELFADAEYRTACITTNPRLELIGADRGFDEFLTVSRSTLLKPKYLRTTAKYLTNLRRHSVGIDTDYLRHSFAYVLTDIAKQWIQTLQSGDRPFFLYIHYNEPHRPYQPPLSYRDRFTSEIDATPETAAATAMDIHENSLAYIADGMPFSDDTWAEVESMYDAEIAYTDQMVGELFDSLDTGQDEQTVFAVTADHGEMLGERDILGHLIDVHESLVHVPLVVYGFDEIESQTESIVQHGDLMRTLLAVAGADTTQFDSIDLRDEKREFAISQEHFDDYSNLLRKNPEFDTDKYRTGLSTGLRTADFKLIQSDDETVLYELPDEDTDVSSTYPETVNRLTEDLSRWFTAHGKAVSDTEYEDDYSNKTKKRLEDLGYLT